MRRIILFSIIGYILLGGLLVPGSVIAETPDKATFTVSTYPAWLQTEWSKFRSAFSVDNWEAASEAIQNAREKGKAGGILRFDALSAVLIREGEEAFGTDDPDRGLRAARAALEWSPQYPEASYFLARAYLKESPANILPAARSWVRGLSSAIRDFWHTYYLIGHALLIITASVTGAFLIFTMFVFFRSLPQITHSLYEWEMMTPFGYWGLLALILALALFTGWGFGFILLIIIALCWSFSSSVERVAQGFFVLLASTALYWLPLILSIYSAGLSNDIHVMAHAVNGQAGSPRLEENRGVSGGSSKDFDLILSRAMVNARLENYDAALAEYASAQKIRPDSYLIDNNRGNIYFKTQRVNKALASYREAAKKRPDALIPYFNLHLVYSDIFRFDEAAEAFKQAQRINPEKTQLLSTGNEVIDEVIPKFSIWKKVFSNTDVTATEAARLFGALFHPVQLSQSFYLLIGFIVAIGISRLIFNERYHTHSCGMCRKPICFQCQRRLFDLKVCRTCWTYSRNIKRKGDLREIKVQRKKTRRKATISTLLLPGSGHWFYHNTLRGLLLLALSIGFISFVLLDPWKLQPPGASGGTPGLWLLGIGAVGLVLVYILALLDLRKRLTN